MRPLKLERGIDAVTGATARPWVDSNAWYVRLARTLLEPKALWLAFDPPDTGPVVTETAYLQAIADTEVYGARWVVSLDARLRSGLLDRSASALETWAGIGRSLAFFADAPGLDDLPAGRTARGGLRLRRGERVPVLRGAQPAGAAEQPLPHPREGPRAADAPRRPRRRPLRGRGPPRRRAPEEALRVRRSGGDPDHAARLGGARSARRRCRSVPRYRVYRHGRGRVAVAREAADDPQVLAEDAQLLTSHRHDRVRVFNLGTGHFHCATREDGRAGVLHAFAFPTTYRRGAVTAWFRHPWAAARAFTVGAPEAAAERTVVERGVEFHLPPVPVYSALEVSA